MQLWPSKDPCGLVLMYMSLYHPEKTKLNFDNFKLSLGEDRIIKTMGHIDHLDNNVFLAMHFLSSFSN